MSIQITRSPGVVTQVTHMGTDRLIAMAGWASTDKDTDVYSKSEAEIVRLLTYFMKHKHATPFGHPHIWFQVDDVPLYIVTQWLRHRTWNFSVKSFRYVLGVLRFYLPPKTRRQEGRPSQYRFYEQTGIREGTSQAAMKLAIVASVACWMVAVKCGVANETANRILPYNMLTKFYGTVSLRNCLNFLVLRNDPHAQQEIRELAEQVEIIVADLFPITYKAWVEAGRPQL